MKTRHVGLLTLALMTGCAHGQSSRGTAAASKGEHKPHAVAARERRENAEEEKRAEAAAVKRETAETYGTEPDNTKVNQRDRESSALTPLDQGSEERDRDLTAQIRKAMIGDDTLSFTAKNAKIITRAGLVTLRGTVVNAREKATIEKTALSIAGQGKVVDELEVEE